VALEYEIEGGVLMLRAARVGHAFLRDALGAARSDPAFRPSMPLLFDLRGDPKDAHYDDIRWRKMILGEMRPHFGARWAIVTGTETESAGVQRMLAALSESEGLEARLFAEKAAALRWLVEGCR
jgi:hypothetical protein